MIFALLLFGQWTAANGGTTTVDEILTTATPRPIDTWKNLFSAFNAGNKDLALSYFADRSKYDAILTAMGSDGLKTVSSSLSEIHFTEITPDYAIAQVSQKITNPTTGATQELIRYISFVFVDGKWFIQDF